MRHLTRTIIGAGLLGVFAAAQAQTFVYSNLVSADAALVGISGTKTLTVGGLPIGPVGTTALIDFFPTSLAVGDGTGISNKALVFDYNVSASSLIGGVGVALSGTLGGAGSILFTEIVFDPANNQVANFTNTLTPAGTLFPRGHLVFNGNSYTYTDNQAFILPQGNYRVEKRMSVSVPENFNHNTDFASITIVEQNQQPVPEPATLVGLAVGALGIISRRRRK